MDPLVIGMLGCGTVGTGVARILADHPARIARRCGRPVELRHVVVRDAAKDRGPAVPPVTTDLSTVLNDPAVEIVVEVAGGTTWAKAATLAALKAGKHVVTANKSLLAQHGPEIFDAARRADRAVAFEASVAGGVPVIATLAESLAANQIVAIQGILNGTSNFILTAMAETGQSYAEALAEAQRLGYAEADPTMDVDGTDAAHKLAILAQIAFGLTVPVGHIERRGIAGLHAMDLRFARELGYTVKLLAEAWLTGGELALHVEPVLVRHGATLAQVRGAYNAVQVVGDAVGDVLLQGRGAGMLPTASAVVADIVDLAVGRAQRTFQALQLWSEPASATRLQPAADVASRFYLRLLIEDKPGVLAEVALALARQGISIASVIQHEAEGAAVALVIMTHAAPTGKLRDALTRIDRFAEVAEPGVYYPVAD